MASFFRGLETMMKNINSKKYEKIINIVVLLAISFVFSLQATSDIFVYGGSYTDSSVFQYMGRMILSGGTPYKDAFDHKGPLIYLINALGLLINDKYGIWLLELLSLFVSVLFLFKFTQLFVRNVYGYLIVVLGLTPLCVYFEGGNLTEEYALPFISIALYIFIKYFIENDIKSYDVLICGFSFACVALLRVNMVSLWIVMCFGILVKLIVERKYRNIWLFSFQFFIGVIICILPIMAWLLRNGAFQCFIEDYFRFNSIYAASGADNLVSKLFGVKEVFVHFYSTKLVLIAIVIMFIFVIRTREYINILFLIYMVINGLMLAMSGRTYEHYGMIIVPMLVYPYALCLHFFDSINKKTAMVGIVVLTLLFSGHTWYNLCYNVFVEVKNAGEYRVDSNAVYIADLVKRYSEEDDKILVTDNWDIIYNLSDRFSVTKYSYQSPLALSEELVDEYRNQVKNNQPKVIVLRESFWDYEYIANYVKNNNYEKVGEIEDIGVAVYAAD